jgi:PhnB protein
MTSFTPAGFHALTPYLVVADAERAIAFYKHVFSAAEVLRLVHAGGKIAHAELRIGNSMLMLTEEQPDWGNYAPQSSHGSSGHVHLYVEDVDAVARRALDAGAKELIPVTDQFYGDRGGRFIDPFGHVWIISTHREDMTPEEMQRRFDAVMKS